MSLALKESDSKNNQISDKQLKDIEQKQQSYTLLYRKMKLGKIFPKFHIFEEHCLPWIKKNRFGLGLHGEQDVEQLHKSIYALEHQARGIIRCLDKLKVVMTRHLCQVWLDLNISK